MAENQNGGTNGDGAQDLNEFEQAKADARREFQGLELKALVLKQAEYRDRKAELERQLAKCNGAYDVLRFELVPGKMDEQGIENIRYPDIGRVSLTPDLLVSTKPGMKDRLFGWLKKNKLGDLIQPAVNSSTLKAFVKGRMRDGKSYPQEFLNITPVTRASITKN